MKNCRHYYVAVASEDLKLSTLIDLVCALQGRGPCAFAIVCSARDELDKLVTGLCQVKDTSVACLHSDMDQRQRDDTVASFLEHVSGQASHTSSDNLLALRSSASAEMLVTTDFCLKAFEDEGRPSLKLSLLVNYDLPNKREICSRRLQTVCKAAAEDSDSNAAIAMYFVTAGQMAQLRALEGFLGPAHLEVMPVHVADILHQT